MIIVMTPQATSVQVDAVIARIRAAGLSEHVSRGVERTLIGAVGDERPLSAEQFASLPGVERAIRVMKPYRLVSRDTHPDRQPVRVRGKTIGSGVPVLLPGVPLIGSEADLERLAGTLAGLGSHYLRAGLFRSVANPWHDQGLGMPGVERLGELARAHGLTSVTTIADTRQLEECLQADIDMLELAPGVLYNPVLLRETGHVNKPVLLRGCETTPLTDWLMAAEQIASGGNHSIVFCLGGAERFDVSAIARLQRETHLPVVCEPDFPGIRQDQVMAQSLAALAAGADGLVVHLQGYGTDEADNALDEPHLSRLSRLLPDLYALTRPPAA
ncbi:3-deoxy-7-phosphoheptulonate synthase [Paludibacterium paludis]|uniref:3-deoxy-7-phosphoheptulonate synthase n=1 Tax=Paludibacterium paludis TaxID=1225769 RepID=A0A918UBJ4_9NEIS|nr:3-deoxy-7-phosphoheptulonate synthase [Paludibacterium paludis]GGY22540.1 3-deoxy-7-phosphoheptulonate synthase [Paludibacterium paludis]